MKKKLVEIEVDVSKEVGEYLKTTASKRGISVDELCEEILQTLCERSKAG